MSIPLEVQQWLAKYPPGKNQDTEYIGKEEVKDWLEHDKKDFAIIDLRKNDFVGGNIKGALNIPAQSIHGELSTLYDLFEASGKTKLILHCSKSDRVMASMTKLNNLNDIHFLTIDSSRDRATKSWSWFKDLAEQRGNKVTPYVLKGGIREWISGGEQYTDLVDEYDPEAFK